MSRGSEPQQPAQRSIEFHPSTLCIQADNVPAEVHFKKYEKHLENYVQGMSFSVIN
jgi:hypothetical protein